MPDDRAAILIIDGDSDTCELLMLLLQMDDSDYEIIACLTIEEAKEQLRAKHFDLILLDYWLSGCRGTELCREVRSAGQQIPILMYTAFVANEAREEAIRSGVDLYLIKPNDLDRLPISVRELLSGRPTYIPDSPCGEARSQIGRHSAFISSILRKA